jgi:hypothetical protein
MVRWVYRKPYPDFSRNRIGQTGAMIGPIWFVLAVLASPFESKSRLEGGAPTSADRFAAQGEGASPAYQQRPLVPRPDLSMVSIDPDGRCDCPT